MERSVVISGVLISASFLLAVLLNRAVVEDIEERRQAPAVPAAVVEPVSPGIAVSERLEPPSACDCERTAPELTDECRKECAAAPD